MRLLILSDLHGNKQALQAVLARVDREYAVEGLLLLGDVIDYGMHSNEVIEILKGLPWLILANIRGNHEDAVLEERYERFSSERGRQCAQYTRGLLRDASWEYLRHAMSGSGRAVFECGGKSCLAVHGSLEDELWGTIAPESDLDAYREYDYVFSGHSHRPHCFERYYQVEDIAHRNRKKVLFLNPGSVGQPRNLNPCAQFAVFDTETEEAALLKVPYDIKNEQADYTDAVDSFYRDRLERGI